MLRKLLSFILLLPAILFTVALSIIGLNDLIVGRSVKTADAPALNGVSVDWREKELQQAASIRAYGTIVIGVQACGLRSDPWTWQLVNRVNEVTSDRNDLSEEFEHAKNVAPNGGISARECEAIASLLPNAEHVLDGSQAILDPVYFTTIGDGHTYKP